MSDKVKHRPARAIPMLKYLAYGRPTDLRIAIAAWQQNRIHITWVDSWEYRSRTSSTRSNNPPVL